MNFVHWLESNWWIALLGMLCFLLRQVGESLSLDEEEKELEASRLRREKLRRLRGE